MPFSVLTLQLADHRRGSEPMGPAAQLAAAAGHWGAVAAVPRLGDPTAERGVKSRPYIGARSRF